MNPVPSWPTDTPTGVCEWPAFLCSPRTPDNAYTRYTYRQVGTIQLCQFWDSLYYRKVYILGRFYVQTELIAIALVVTQNHSRSKRQGRLSLKKVETNSSDYVFNGGWEGTFAVTIGHKVDYFHPACLQLCCWLQLLGGLREIRFLATVDLEKSDGFFWRDNG
ncbi:hypothetical protein J6590_004512 [Homalodisca vitripennis]|nr:hypothetical protein J6590_004512 [Homalodisca vitripennis]